MTTSTNNWMLIKIIKLFGALTPLEPRLGKKLIEPLTNLIHSTSAMSLLYECINTVIAVLISISSGMPNHTAAIQLCVQKLRILIEDSDQNLKYLGLLAMSKILKTNPKSVQGHKDLIMQCLDDSDDSIRLRALDLLYGMVSKKNLMEIVKKLMAHMDKAEGTTYRDELMHKTIQICSQNDYQYITNFEWYVSVLVELAQIDGSKHGSLIASQMMDVTIRVESIRVFAVKQMSLLLENHHVLMTNQRGCSTDVLYAASWICGEFASHLTDPEATLKALCRSKVLTLPGHVQSIYIQNAMKLYAFIVQNQEDLAKIDELSTLVQDALKSLTSSANLEVQERASVMLHYVKYVAKNTQKSETKIDLDVFFAGDLNPVAPKAQRKVPVPEGLDLDAWINDPPSESESDDEDDGSEFDHEVFVKTERAAEKTKAKKEPSEAEMKKYREARMLQQQSDPNYLKATTATNDIPVEQIPIKKVSDLGGIPPLLIPGLASTDHYFDVSSPKKSKKKKKDKKRKKDAVAQPDEEDEPAPVIHVLKEAEMPEGVEMSDGEDEDAAHSEDEESHRALRNITLDDVVVALDESKLTNGNSFGSTETKKKRKKKKKPAKSEEETENVPDTNDVNYWLGNSAGGGSDAVNGKKEKRKKKKSKKSAVQDLMESFSEESVKRGKRTLLDHQSLHLSCSINCSGGDRAEIAFVIENRGEKATLSEFKFDFETNSYATVIQDEDLQHAKLDRQGQRLLHKVQLKVKINHFYIFKRFLYLYFCFFSRFPMTLSKPNWRPK